MSDLHEGGKDNVIFESLSLPNQVQRILGWSQSLSKRLNVPAADIVLGIIERKADTEIADMDC